MFDENVNERVNITEPERIECYRADDSTENLINSFICNIMNLYRMSLPDTVLKCPCFWTYDCLCLVNNRVFINRRSHIMLVYIFMSTNI